MSDAEAIIVRDRDLKTQLLSFGGHDAAVRDFAERLLATVNTLDVQIAFRQMMNTNNMDFALNGWSNQERVWEFNDRAPVVNALIKCLEGECPQYLRAPMRPL